MSTGDGWEMQSCHLPQQSTVTPWCGESYSVVTGAWEVPSWGAWLSHSQLGSATLSLRHQWAPYSRMGAPCTVAAPD